MNAKLWIALAAGLAASPVSFVQAQDAAKPAATVSADEVDPAAREFITKFRAAIRDVKDVSCTVEQTSKMDGKGETTKGEILATIIRAPGSNSAGMVKLFKITAKTEQGDTVWAFDGKASTRLDHAKKTFASVDAPDGQAFPPAEAYTVFPSWALSDILTNPAAKLVAAKMMPDAKVNGTDCKVVAYTVEVPMPDPEGGEGKGGKMLLKQVRAIGAEDLLPRRIESVVTMSGEVPDGAVPRSFLGNYTNVKANTKPAASAFALKAADGYKTVQVDAQDLGVPSDEQPKLKFAEGDAAPDFVLSSADSKQVSLSGLKGKVVLLDFWATWCGPCVKAMPSIQKLHEKYKDKAVAIYGVNTWERGAADLAQKYMEKNNFTYGLLLKGDELAKAYGVSGIPTLVLIGPDGKILHLAVGFGPGEEEHLSDMIDKALASK